MYCVTGRLHPRKGGRGGGDRTHTPSGKGGGDVSTKIGSSVSVPPSTATHTHSRLLPSTTVGNNSNNDDNNNNDHEIFLCYGDKVSLLTFYLFFLL